MTDIHAVRGALHTLPVQEVLGADDTDLRLFEQDLERWLRRARNELGIRRIEAADPQCAARVDGCRPVA